MRCAGSNYVLLWSVNGVNSEFTLRTSPYFLGRPSLADLRMLADALPQRPTALDILAYPASPPVLKGYAVVTGLRSSVVSRRHVKLTISKEALSVTDHGPEGRGSRNGTFVNGVRLGRGETIAVEGGCVLRLASSGPVFILGVRVGDSILLRLPASVPVDLPLSIAEGLRGSGATLELQEVGEGAVAVLKAGVFSMPSSRLIVEARPHPEVEGLRRRYRVLTDMLHALHTALEALQRGDLSVADAELARLRMDIYSKTLKELGDRELLRAYEELMLILRHGGVEYSEAVHDRLSKLCGMVKAAIDSL